MGRPLGNILVVDDNEMNRDLLSRRLARKGHTVEVAEGGHRALEMIGDQDFDLVLLDIMMPGIDGFEVLEKIRGDYGPSDLPVIMATAKTESEDIVAALKIGANDYVTKPFDFPVVLARVRTQLELKKSRDALAAAHHRMRKDLEAAAAIQQTLLPAANPEVAGARCAWRYVPCDELAGDTLNAVPLGDGLTGLFVLDVSGHGVPSSLLSVTLSRLLGSAPDSSSVLWVDDDAGGRRPATPVEVAAELSQRFTYDVETRQYFTMVYGVLDPGNRLFTYTSAGHPPIVRIRGREEAAIYSSTGPPIALLPAILGPSTYTQTEISLQPGDRLYLFSDGISEAHEPGGEEYGSERIAETLQAGLDLDLDESIASLLHRVREWGGGAGHCDDVSILAIEIEAAR